VDGDEIDPVVDASDMEMINEAVKEIMAEGQLSPLTDEEVKLGQYSVAKVISYFVIENITDHPVS
jgi:hypothetical protein